MLKQNKIQNGHIIINDEIKYRMKAYLNNNPLSLISCTQLFYLEGMGQYRKTNNRV